jgi:hypothetical protein
VPHSFRPGDSPDAAEANRWNEKLQKLAKFWQATFNPGSERNFSQLKSWWESYF